VGPHDPRPRAFSWVARRDPQFPLLQLGLAIQITLAADPDQNSEIGVLVKDE
jgi:hypothetical protein